MSNSLEELKNEFINQASNNIDKCPECGFHSLSKLEDAWDAAIKAVSEREKKLVDILSQINIDNPSFEDSRIEWMEIQIDKSLAKEIREFLAEIKKEGL